MDPPNFRMRVLQNYLVFPELKVTLLEIGLVSNW